MKIFLKINLLLFISLIFFNCNRKTETAKPVTDSRKSVEMVTDLGTMVIELYNETPLHRDNFIKLVHEKAYDSLLFHRVIENFMIQGGDPDSKNALASDRLGNGGLDYRIKAEFNSELFHKKGALASARGNNPDRESNSIQFYLVQGKVLNDSLLLVAETRINGWLAEHYSRKDPANKLLVESLQNAIDDENMESYTIYNDSLKKLAESYTNFNKYTIPETHRKVYKSIGGTPHLDQNYTVFGEIVSGLEVVDSIASVKTGLFNRPVSNIRIISVRVLE